MTNTNAYTAFKWTDCAKYLKAVHLDHKPVTVTIKRVVLEDAYSKTEQRKRQVPVVYFNELKPGLPLSEINQTKLCELFGNDVNNCIGKRVLLTPTSRRVGNEQKEPIYICAVAPINSTTQFIGNSTSLKPVSPTAVKPSASTVKP